MTYPTCPRCGKGRMIPMLMSGPACDLACEREPKVTPIGRVGAKEISFGGISASLIAGWTRTGFSQPAPVAPLTGPYKADGRLIYQHNPNTGNSRFVFEFRYTNHSKFTNRTGRIETQRWSCPIMVKSAGKAFLVFELTALFGMQPTFTDGEPCTLHLDAATP
jgi:hypothetical protein